MTASSKWMENLITRMCSKGFAVVDAVIHNGRWTVKHLVHSYEGPMINTITVQEFMEQYSNENEIK